MLASHHCAPAMNCSMSKRVRIPTTEPFCWTSTAGVRAVQQARHLLDRHVARHHRQRLGHQAFHRTVEHARVLARRAEDVRCRRACRRPRGPRNTGIWLTSCCSISVSATRSGLADLDRQERRQPADLAADHVGRARVTAGSSRWNSSAWAQLPYATLGIPASPVSASALDIAAGSAGELRKTTSRRVRVMPDR